MKAMPRRRLASRALQTPRRVFSIPDQCPPLALPGGKHVNCLQCFVNVFGLERILEHLPGRAKFGILERVESSLEHDLRKPLIGEVF